MSPFVYCLNFYFIIELFYRQEILQKFGVNIYSHFMMTITIMYYKLLLTWFYSLQATTVPVHLKILFECIYHNLNYE